MDVKNLNDKQIAGLTDQDIFEINEILKRYPEFLAYFNYSYLYPAEKMKFKVLKQVYMKICSMYRPVGPDRWENWKTLN